MVAGGISCHLLEHITEIVGRHAQLVSAILHCRQTERQLEFLPVITLQQIVEPYQYIGILQFACNELPVVETLAEVQHQIDIADDDGILQLIVFLLQFLAYLAHQRSKDVVLFVRHVEGFIDTVVEKRVIPDGLLQRSAVQQIGMEKQGPACQHHFLPIVLLAAYLSGSHTDDRTFLVVVLAAAVCEVYLRLVMEKDAVHAVIVQAVTHGRHFRIVDDADQRMLLLASEIAAVVAYILDFHYLRHPDVCLFHCCKCNEFPSDRGHHIRKTVNKAQTAHLSLRQLP